MKVSVVVPVYNRSALVRATLDSVLAQTLAPLEIIVVDDGSTDNTSAWIEANYAGEVRVIRQSNGGVARARNRGLQEARGEYIAFLDHDDIWHPAKLKRQLEALEDEPQAALCWCLWCETEGDGSEREVGKRLFDQPFWRGRSGHVFDDFIPKNVLLSASVPLIRTRCLRAIGGFDTQTQPSDDWDCWLRLSHCYSFVFLDETLLDYCWHANNQSRDEIAMWRGSQRALIKHWPRLLRRPRTLLLVLGLKPFLRTAEPFYQEARAAIAQSNWKQVRRSLVECFVRHPFIIFIPQWIYVFIRLLKRDSRPF